MATLTWDTIGERTYQTGVDRGVLYLSDGRVFPWSGLIAVEEGGNSELKSYYLDGVKFLENLSPGDFQGKLKAFTYPDEFEEALGIAEVESGFSLYEQPPKSFSISYRTSIGDDLNPLGDRGYKIHILYNLLAVTDTHSYESTSDGISPIAFSWSLTGTPPRIHKYRPTVHVVLNSTKTPPDILKILENRLYGTETSPPSLPPITDVAEYYGYLGALIIIDNGDGTWTAFDESDNYITMVNETTFQIDNADATLVGNVYDISSTNVGGGL